MAKLRAGSTILFSYERKKNDVYGNPRHKAKNISAIKKGKVVRLIDEVDIGYRTPEQAVFDALQNKKLVPQTKRVEPMLSEREAQRLKQIIGNANVPAKDRREALRKLYKSGKDNYWEIRKRYTIKQI